MGGHSVSSWSANWVTERPELLIDKAAQLTLVRGSMWVLVRSSTGHVGNSQANIDLPFQHRKRHVHLPSSRTWIFPTDFLKAVLQPQPHAESTTRARPNLDRPTFEHSPLNIS